MYNSLRHFVRLVVSYKDTACIRALKGQLQRPYATRKNIYEQHFTYHFRQSKRYDSKRNRREYWVDAQTNFTRTLLCYHSHLRIYTIKEQKEK